MTKASFARTKKRLASNVLRASLAGLKKRKVPPNMDIRSVQKALNESAMGHIRRILPDITLDQVEVQVDARSNALMVRVYKGLRKATILEPDASKEFPSKEFLAKVVMFAQE